MASMAQGRVRFADIILAAVVLTVVGLMIVPLPSWLLDVLLATNIAAGVTLLLVSIYVGSGLEFATFPTLLLVTTLFRLGLNVSSTRLILLNAEAGDVIAAFGQFVVGGNYIVGGVIFLILTLIQFIVIAKGSERVAEVGARFALDAMPGKQMSIDAELRSGSIGNEEARRRRNLLQTESQFYGAMDGAMKFVKGDAIAGVLITVINIVGGLVVGMVMHDMSASDSAATFSLLTIGDGLVSQIPALLISTAAGIVVTRVASDQDSPSLGAEIASQLFRHTRALRVGGSFLLLLGAIPGLPLVPFLLLGLGLWALSFRYRAPAEVAAVDAKGPGATSDAGVLVPIVSPLSLIFGARDKQNFADVQEEVQAQLRNRIYIRTGISVPALRIVQADGFEPGEASLHVQEVPAASLSTAEPMTTQGWVDLLEPILVENVHRLVGVQETQQLVDAVEAAYPALVRAVVPKPLPVTTLVDVIKRHLEEGVSVRPFRELLESLAKHAASGERDALTLTELSRADLARQLSHRFAPSGVVAAVLLDPEIEDAIRSAIQHTDGGSYLALAPAASRDILQAVRLAIGERDIVELRVLTQPDIRRYVRRLVAAVYPALTVLSYADLTPTIRVERVAIARV